MAFLMNATSRKVLRKVLTGFIITEPDMSKKEEDDAPERRGFWDGVVLLFLGAMSRLTKRERERETQKSSKNSNINKKERNGTYA